VLEVDLGGRLLCLVFLQVLDSRVLSGCLVLHLTAESNHPVVDLVLWFTLFSYIFPVLLNSIFFLVPVCTLPNFIPKPNPHTDIIINHNLTPLNLNLNSVVTKKLSSLHIYFCDKSM